MPVVALSLDRSFTYLDIFKQSLIHTSYIQFKDLTFLHVMF